MCFTSCSTGQYEEVSKQEGKVYDKDCFLCPGNKRASGQVNEDYKSTYVFNNDFSGLSDWNSLSNIGEIIHRSPLIKRQEVSGFCRVLCFSPNHGQSFSSLSEEETLKVIRMWKQQFLELSKTHVEYVLLFENKGMVMGCSNPHPHGQLWATSFVPEEPLTELKSFEKHAEEHGSCLLCDYLKDELELGTRILFQNDSFIALVPYWAFWPFELLVLPKKHLRTIDQVDDESDLAGILSTVTKTYDALFNVSFPYSMGIHQAPCPTYYKKSPLNPLDSHLHFHFYPPLLRNSHIKKFYASFELLGELQRDSTPEDALKRLQSALANI